VFRGLIKAYLSLFKGLFKDFKRLIYAAPAIAKEEKMHNYPPNQIGEKLAAANFAATALAGAVERFIDERNTLGERNIDALHSLGFVTSEQRLAVYDIFTAIAEMRRIPHHENPFFQRFDNRRGIIEGYNTFLQRYALRTGERTDIKPPFMNEATLGRLKDSFAKIGMIDGKAPEHIVYDAALCIGSAEAGVRPRIECLAKMVDKPIYEIDNIIMLGSSRKLWPLKKTKDGTSFPEPTLYEILAKRLSERDGKKVFAYEVKNFVARMETKETAVEKLALEVAAHPYFAGISWPTEADLITEIVAETPAFKDKNVIVVNAPDYPDGRHADAARTIATALKEHPDILYPRAGVLAISSQPFIRNQRQVLEQALSENADIEVIGEGIKDFTPKQAMLCLDSLARTVYGALAYQKEQEKKREQESEKKLQEIRTFSDSLEKTR